MSARFAFGCCSASSALALREARAARTARSSCHGPTCSPTFVSLRAPSRRITPVDTVGAGDAFVAGYLSALIAGESPIDRLTLATTCGAFACLGPGDWESFPRTADLARPDRGDPVIR
jgi:2-dehydro-3-deoxygluconokinase